MYRKYLFFYLKTGGGHYAPAKAVARILEQDENHPIDPVLADGMDGAPLILKKMVVDGYSFSQTRSIKSFEFLYALHKLLPFAKMSRAIVTKLITRAVTERIRNERPSVIVNFHFFLIEPIQKAVEKLKLNIPVITVVTDPYTAHPLWFLSKAQKMIVFSEQVKETAIKNGVDASSIRIFPFAIDEKFSTKLSTAEINQLRIKHQFSADKKIVLIMGGGDGLPGATKLLKRLAYHGSEADVILVCGRNQKLYKYAEKLKSEYCFDNLRIYPFVTFIKELLSISDLVITKCGASTFMEILLMNKVPLVNSYIWEQEKGNVEFICKNSFGKYIKSPQKLINEAEMLLNDPLKLKTYENSIKNAGLQNGVREVAGYLNSMTV